MTETASRIIARFGQAGTIVRVENVGNEWEPVQTETAHPVTVAIVDYSQEVRTGTLIGSDDLRALVSVEGLDIVPTTADRLRIGADEFTIVRVSPHAPDGVARFQDMQVRR